jgi:hypothetical protein
MHCKLTAAAQGIAVHGSDDGLRAMPDRSPVKIVTPLHHLARSDLHHRANVSACCESFLVSSDDDCSHRALFRKGEAM